jgi:hypothetical protein
VRPEEYVAKLVQCARKNGFKVQNKSDWSIDVYVKKKPTKVSGSVFDCIAEEFKAVNMEMLAFLVQKTTLQDLATGKKIEFVRETGESGEKIHI